MTKLFTSKRGQLGGFPTIFQGAKITELVKSPAVEIRDSRFTTLTMNHVAIAAM